MRTYRLKSILIFTALLMFSWACNNKKNEQTTMKPPVAKKVPKELTIHGHTRIDNYYWLNERENPEVIDYLNAENAYTKAIMKHTEDFQKKLFDEIVGKIKQNDESVPYKDKGYWYYVRYEENKQYPIYCRKKENMQAKEEIMLNGNEMAEGTSYFDIGGVSVSTDNKLLAYSVDTVSRRKYTIYVKNLETGELLKTKIENTTGGVTWANDNKIFFYSTKDEITLRSDKIWRHSLDKENQKDAMVFFETDDTFSTYVYKSKSEKYIIIGSQSTLSTENRILLADKPTGEFKVFQPRQRDLEYSISHFEDRFYITTNADGAKNFKLMQTFENKTGKENWTEVIATRPDVLLEGVEMFKNYMVVQERSKALNQLRIINMQTKDEHYLDFGEPVYSAGISINPEFDTEVLRYEYTSLTTPNSTLDYNMATKQKTLLKEQEVVGGYDKKQYKTERLFAKAADGTQIPISIVYKKGLKKDGKAPMLLYAYGSYGYSMEPYFTSARLSLLDRGFSFAIAHIRGGQELGRQWYEDGKLLKKKNTFTDFNDCAEFLIKEKFTSPQHLYAEGGSAGGLLMGAIANMRPDLYNGILAAVPFVDVVTTMLDETIPLTTGEFDEWGNPKVKEYYDYMLSYSPYDQVKAQNYPNMLVTTGLHDSQVQYFEPAKWVAKLRDMKTDNNMLIIDIDMKSGHGGASGRFDRYKTTALEYAFLLNLEGILE